MLPSPWAPARSASSCLKSSPSQTYTGFPQDGSIPPTRRLFSLLRVRVWLEYSGTACMWLLLGLDGRVWKLEPMGRGRWGGGIFSSEELFIPLSWGKVFSKYVPFHAGKAHQKLNCNHNKVKMSPPCLLESPSFSLSDCWYKNKKCFINA